MTYPNAERSGDPTHSVSLITSPFVCVGLAPDPAASVAGAFQPLSGGCTHADGPFRGRYQCWRNGAECIHPSAALHINRGAASAVRRFGHALPNAPHSLAALDTYGRAA